MSGYRGIFPAPSGGISPFCPAQTASPKSVVVATSPYPCVEEVTPDFEPAFMTFGASWTDCGKISGDLEAHMPTHQNERLEKCPITTCEYHIKGFTGKYDRNKHTIAHYKGTMVCGFCPGSGSAAEKAFNRADVFKRHLTAVHGVEQTPPSSRRSTISGAISTLGSANSLTGYAPDATGICSTCSVTFSNAQDFYEHLDDCLLLSVLQEDPSEAINAKRLAATVDEHVRDTPGKSRLPTGHFVSGPGDEAKGREGVDDEGQMMKQRAMTLFDGPRRLAKDEKMLSTDHELRIKLLYGKSQLIGPHVQTHEAAEGVPIATPTDEELHLILDEEMQSTIEVADPLVHSTAPDVANQSTERTEPNTTSERLSTKTSVSTIIGNDNQQPADSEDSTGPEAFKVSLQHKVEDDIVQVGMPGTYGMSFPALHAAEMSGCTTDGSESFTSSSSPENSPSPGKIASSKKEVIIKRILGRFKTWLDSRLTLLAYQLDGGGPSFGLNDNSAILDQNEGQPGQAARGDKRGRDSDDPDGSDDGKDDKDRKGSREPKQVKTDQEGGLDFACPFLKHNVRKYQTKRCCAWSGWKTVHRVKYVQAHYIASLGG